MINYTDRLSRLMQDIVERVPALSFIDMGDLLVFARPGRSNADGPFATCHCLTLPQSEQGYYFWRDRKTGRMTRRSEWFITKSPVVTIGRRDVKYMISFVLPRFCDQSIDRARKRRFYPGAEPWMAKLDTVVHELYHIDPAHEGIRRVEGGGRVSSTSCHGHHFFEQVAQLVATYLATRPDPEVYDFLRHDLRTLESRFGAVAAATFRTFPSFPQRYLERAASQPACEADTSGVVVEALRLSRRPTRYGESDLDIRQFGRKMSRRVRPGEFKAA